MRNNSLPFVKTWMDFEYIVQNEINQTENGKNCMILLTHEILKSLFHGYTVVFYPR